MKKRNIMAFPSFGRDPNKELSKRLILGIAFIVLSGLRTLIVLRALKLAVGIFGIISAMPSNTTKKSIQFHPSLRYAHL